MKESLDQQVHRLLGRCWHLFSEGEIEDCVGVWGGKVQCVKCNYSTVWTDIANPQYSISLDAAWACLLPLHNILMKKTGENRTGMFDHWLVSLPREAAALAICKAFVMAHDEQPADICKLCGESVLLDEHDLNCEELVE